MRHKLALYALLLSLLAAFTVSCKGKKSDKKPETVKEAASAPVIGNETMLLLKDLEENGDYVNSQYFPSLIKASVVNEELGGKNLVLDLRSPELFARGHIKGAVNKQFSELPEYFQSGIKPFEFDKIILVCEDGQVSSYTTALLRMMGYGNVFAMRWGMGGWNKAYAEESWMKGLSGQVRRLVWKLSRMKYRWHRECRRSIPALQQERRSETSDSESSLWRGRHLSLYRQMMYSAIRRSTL